MNCTENYIEPQKLKAVYVTIMDVSGSSVTFDLCNIVRVVTCRYLMSQHCHNGARRRCTSVILTLRELI